MIDKPTHEASRQQKHTAYLSSGDGYISFSVKGELYDSKAQTALYELIML